jgi:hypothetical protein
MITVSKRFRQLLPAAVVAVALATGANTVTYSAIASAERVWDIEDYDTCEADQTENQLDLSINSQKAFHVYCCNRSGGIFVDDGYLGKCVAPPAEQASGTRQLPGDVHIPSDIATAPVVTQAPPTQVASGIATAPTETAS